MGTQSEKRREYIAGLAMRRRALSGWFLKLRARHRDVGSGAAIGANSAFSDKTPEKVYVTQENEEIDSTIEIRVRLTKSAIASVKAGTGSDRGKK